MQDISLTELEFRAIEQALYESACNALSNLEGNFSKSRKIELENNLKAYQSAFDKLCLALGKKSYKLIDRIHEDWGI